MTLPPAQDVEEWVHSFLLGPGNNKALSDGLKLQRRHWSGPVRLPLLLLSRCCGPEEGMEFAIPQESWEERIGRMERLLASGWEPAPLIVHYEGGLLVIRDGNHRHEAMRRQGAQSCYAIIWCDSAEELGMVRRLLAQ